MEKQVESPDELVRQLASQSYKHLEGNLALQDTFFGAMMCHASFWLDCQVARNSAMKF